MPTEITSNSIETTSYIITSKSNVITIGDKATLDTDLGVIYVLAGLGGGILILTLCIITVCIYFCLRLARRKRQVFTFTADNVYSMEDHELPQQQNGK